MPVSPPSLHRHPRLRRKPLSGAINTLVLLDIPPKLSSHEKMSLSLPRQNSKIQPPSLPQVIQDKTGSLRYQRVSFLGEVAIYLFRPYLVLTYHNIAGRVR